MKNIGKPCPVLGCKSTRKKSSLHFFRLPKVSKKFGDVGRVSLWNFVLIVLEFFVLIRV